MSSNQEKLQEASSLLKEVDASKGDLDKQIKLLNQVNTLIAQVNVELNPKNSQRSVEATSQAVNSQSKTVYQDNKVTVSMPGNSQQTASSAQQSVKVKPAAQAASTDAHKSLQTNEVHMSRKQYREMLNKEK